MHTEEEAKGNYCPLYVMMLAGKELACGMTCDASDCMMWRWDTSIIGKEGVGRGEPRKGYCGIGGRP